MTFQGKSVVLSFSGGLDSTVLAYWLLSQQVSHLRLISFDYGQRNKKELTAATIFGARMPTLAHQAARAGKWQYTPIVGHRIADIRALAPVFGKNPLTHKAVALPQGGTTLATTVPNRNMIFLSIATAWAQAAKADYVCFAATLATPGATMLADLRPEFIMALDRAIQLSDYHKVQLSAPFAGNTRTELVKLGRNLGVPFDLTWTCHDDKAKQCGVCATCTNRRAAFAEAGVDDPTEYEA